MNYNEFIETYQSRLKKAIDVMVGDDGIIETGTYEWIELLAIVNDMESDDILANMNNSSFELDLRKTNLLYSFLEDFGVEIV